MTAPSKAWSVADEVLRARCWFCGALPKVPCVSRADGRLVPESHDARWLAARLPRPGTATPARGTTPGEDWTVRLLAGCTTADHDRRQAEAAAARHAEKQRAGAP